GDVEDVSGAVRAARVAARCAIEGKPSSAVTPHGKKSVRRSHDAKFDRDHLRTSGADGGGPISGGGMITLI
ncbi:MAG: hypothetical protein ACK4V1_14610, partial [Burkholderiaceae bacterium]